MRNPSCLRAAFIVVCCLSVGFPAGAQAQKAKVAMSRASGTFEVKLVPREPDQKTPEVKPEEAPPGRMTIDKQFHGGLEATSKGQMLAVMTAVKGSAGYVAMERVTGTLQGRTGTFVLQHTGTMTRGAPQLTVTVVPDSGTGQLVGLAGKMTIDIAGGQHSYEFEYTFAETP